MVFCRPAILAEPRHPNHAESRNKPEEYRCLVSLHEAGFIHDDKCIHDAHGIHAQWNSGINSSKTIDQHPASKIMYLDHFGLREPPFLITPHTEFFFDGANRGAMLDALLYATLHDEGIIKISGEVGSGKTMLCRMLMERLPEHVTIVYLANPSLSREDILYAIADELELKLPDNARASQVLRNLQQHLVESFGAGRRVAVLIDEAHAMPAETLEQIRLLSNLESNRHKLLQLVLFGQPELNAILARTDMRQLKERITHHFELSPLVREDIASYLDFRMRAAGYRGPAIFSPVAVKMIAQASLGLTRRINILADKALLAAFTAGTHQVGRKEARAAVRDCDFSDIAPLPRARPRQRLLLGGMAIVFVGIALWLLRPAPEDSTMRMPPRTMPAAQAKQAPVTNASTAPSPGASSPPSSPSSTLTPLIEHYLTTGQRWLTQAPEGHWFIQLMMTDVDQAAQVDRFLRNLKRDALDTDQLHLYIVSTEGKSRLGVIYGDYATQADALVALDQLPRSLRKTKPYLRQVVRLK